MNNIKLLLLAGLIILQGCLTESDPDLKKDFTTLVPVQIGDGWQLSTPEVEQINCQKLEHIYRSVQTDADLWQIRSLLVFRNDKLVAESYMKDDADRIKQRAIWSCTKQVMGILTGIALDKGLITSIDDPIEKYLPDEVANHPDKSGITIRNLLTMQSGIGFYNDEHSEIFLGRHVKSSVDFILGLPKVNEPGIVCSYNDGDPHLLSAILQKVTGKQTDGWADEVLFSKLNLTNYSWYKYYDGITLGGFGILVPPRELAKIAQCVKSKGFVSNYRIVSEDWINEMTSIKTHYEKWGFGYFWWKENDRNIFFMWGHGGQFAFVVPDKNLVVVITSETNTDDTYQLAQEKAVQVIDQIVSTCY